MPARGVNKVILVGNVGQDPEVRYMPNGDAVANVSLATSESWKDKNSGEQQERTEWHRLVFYKRLAEIVAEYVRKGSKLYAEGRLRTRSWEQDGVKRYATEIVVDNMQMLGDAGQASQGAPQQRQAGSGGNAYRAARDGSKAPSGGRATDSQDHGAPMGGDMYDDDIPF